jgi:hypothetical protein
MRPSSGSSGDMDRDLDFLRSSDPLELDDGTVDRLLDGMAADDAPPSYRHVTELLRTLTVAPTAEELRSERSSVSSVVEQARATRMPASSKRTAKRRFRTIGAALLGSATLFVGLGAAGALPDGAQSLASAVLARVGINAPTPDSHADDRGDTGPAGGSNSPTAVLESSKVPTDTTAPTDTAPVTGNDRGAAPAA